MNRREELEARQDGRMLDILEGETDIVISA